MPIADTAGRGALFFSPPQLKSRRSRRGRGRFFSSKGKLLPQGKESLCGRKFASFRRAKKLRAHAGKFLCARKFIFVRTEFERFTQALLSPCPLPSFSLVNRPPIPRGLPWSACPPAESPSAHREILPYKPYLCIPQWLGGSHPTLKGRAFRRINDNDAEIRYP